MTKRWSSTVSNLLMTKRRASKLARAKAKRTVIHAIHSQEWLRDPDRDRETGAIRREESLQTYDQEAETIAAKIGLRGHGAEDANNISALTDQVVKQASDLADKMIGRATQKR